MRLKFESLGLPLFPTTPAVQLPISLGAAVDAMSSLSELNALIALANNRKIALEAAIQGGSG